MGWLAVVIALFPFATSAWAADDDIVGTYRLISANRVILATGDTEDSYGKNPIGFMTYGRDGRMMGMIVFSNRPKAESLDKMTDQQRADLFRTMIAYGGEGFGVSTFVPGELRLGRSALFFVARWNEIDGSVRSFV